MSYDREQKLKDVAEANNFGPGALPGALSLSEQRGSSRRRSLQQRCAAELRLAKDGLLELRCRKLFCFFQQRGTCMSCVAEAPRCLYWWVLLAHRVERLHVTAGGRHSSVKAYTGISAKSSGWYISVGSGPTAVDNACITLRRSTQTTRRPCLLRRVKGRKSDPSFCMFLS